jgi:NhaP-type Na+/H+ or K+/H+ antiporter
VNTHTVLAIGLLVVGYTLISGKVRNFPIIPAMVFVAVGLLLGPDVLDLVEIRVDERGFQALAELTLTLMLFLQASRIDFRTTFRNAPLAKRLVTVGLPLSIALGTVAALLIFSELPFWEAAILAIIVAPTEAALIKPVIEDQRVPESIRQALKIESGLGDGVCLGLLLIAMALASETVEGNVVEWISFVGKSLGMSVAVGLAIGLLGGWLLASGKKSGRVTETWSQLYMIALAALTFVVVEHIDGSGFVGAFGAGLGFALLVPRVEEESGTAEAFEELLELVVFALFGAAAVVPAFEHLDVSTLVYAILALWVIRTLGVALATVRMGLSRATKLYIGWFGPRGIASMILGFIVLEEGVLEHPDLIIQVVVVTITLSIFLHGLTARWGVNRYAKTTESTTESQVLTE